MPRTQLTGSWVHRFALCGTLGPAYRRTGAGPKTELSGSWVCRKRCGRRGQRPVHKTWGERSLVFYLVFYLVVYGLAYVVEYLAQHLVGHSV